MGLTNKRDFTVERFGEFWEFLYQYQSVQIAFEDNLFVLIKI